MNLKTTALKSNLKDSPRTTLPENTKSVDLQSTSLKPKGFQTEPTSVKYGANTPNGELQTTSLKLKLSNTPSLGYESANTPMSNRAVDSKKNF
jgi:hypothetical protein